MTVSPGSSLQAAVNANPAGTTFCIKAGTYSLTTGVSPKNDQKFIGEPGVVLSGGKDISGQFAQSGSYWVASNQTQRNPNSGSTAVCYPAGATACQYAEDVYRDKKPLKRVLSLSELSSGEFYFDYGSSRIYLADNPAGHKIEAAVGTRAFVSGASGVTIRNLVVELFANETGAGAIWANYDWVVENNEVRLNHGIGILAGGTVRSNYVHDNGQAGIATISAPSMLVENNEIAYNNYADYDTHYDGGGTKFMKSLNLTVRGNYAHHNYGSRPLVRLGQQGHPGREQHARGQRRPRHLPRGRLQRRHPQQHRAPQRLQLPLRLDRRQRHPAARLEQHRDLRQPGREKPARHRSHPDRPRQRRLRTHTRRTTSASTTTSSPPSPTASPPASSKAAATPATTPAATSTSNTTPTPPAPPPTGPGPASTANPTSAPATGPAPATTQPAHSTQAAEVRKGGTKQPKTSRTRRLASQLGSRSRRRLYRLATRSDASRVPRPTRDHCAAIAR